jgi:hypothetical protein
VSVRQPRTPHANAHGAHGHIAIFPDFCRSPAGGALAHSPGMIWFLEKQNDLLVCEIRRAADDETAFEFEIADSKGPTTHRFDSPSELITKYLREQSRLMAQGWRPRAGDIDALE